MKKNMNQTEVVVHMNENRPNVLFIAVDDLRPQLRCYGVDWVISPHMDALAHDGILFERAYCQQAICAPSRCSVLSGCRPDTTGVYYLDKPLRNAMPDVLTLPEHFRKNGYETISIGKIYHHQDDDSQGWSKEPIMAKGDWQGRGYLTDEAIELVKTNGRGLGPAYESADVNDDDYQDGKNTRFACEELRRLKDAGKPFFLAMGFLKPHLPFSAPRKYWDMYPQDSIKLAENAFEPANINEYSLTDYGELRQYFDIPRSEAIDEDLAYKLVHGYCACVTYIDTLLGNLLGELDRLGLRENTIIALWGDHGWKLGEHASWSKHTNFEIDTRSPLILSMPGMKNARRKTRALVEFVDIYPTLADLCGLDIPAHLEGLSFAPLLQNPDLSWKKAAFSQFPREWLNVMGYTVRTDDFRYVQWRDMDSQEVKAEELYDHRLDDLENANLADCREYAKIKGDLAITLRSGWKSCLPDHA